MAVTSPSNKSMNWKVLTGLVVVIIVYLVIGGISFHVIEHTNELAQRDHIRNYTDRFLERHPCVEKAELRALVIELLKAYNQGILAHNDSHTSHWDIWSSMFFSSTIITTIGYGHIAPNTFVGRLVCIFYALLGIPLCLTMLAGVGEKMTKIDIKLDKFLDCCHKCPKVGSGFRTLFLFCIGLAVFLLIPAYIFAALENWSFFEGVYFGFISLTTIGLGDYVAGTSAAPEHTWYRILVSLWLGLGLAWVATLISSIRENMQNMMGCGESKEDAESQSFKRKTSSAVSKDEDESPVSALPDNGNSDGKVDCAPNNKVSRENSKDYNKNNRHNGNGDAHFVETDLHADIVPMKEIVAKETHAPYNRHNPEDGLVNGPTNHNVPLAVLTDDSHLSDTVASVRSDQYSHDSGFQTPLSIDHLSIGKTNDGQNHITAASVSVDT